MSDLRDTIAVNSPSSAPRRGQKRGAASSTTVPVSLGSKRRPAQKYCVVQLIAVPKKNVSVSLFHPGDFVFPEVSMGYPFQI